MQEGRRDVLELLLARGAPVDRGDGLQRTPLWCAAYYGHAEVSEYMGLIGSGMGLFVG